LFPFRSSWALRAEREREREGGRERGRASEGQRDRGRKREGASERGVKHLLHSEAEALLDAPGPDGLLPLMQVLLQSRHLQRRGTRFTEMCSGSEEGSYLRLID